LKIVDHTDLARQPGVIAEIGFGRQDSFLGLADRSRIAAKYFDAAGSAPGVAAASMQDINAGVLESKYELLPIFNLD